MKLKNSPRLSGGLFFNFTHMPNINKSYRFAGKVEAMPRMIDNNGQSMLAKQSAVFRVFAKHNIVLGLYGHCSAHFSSIFPG